MSEDLESLDRPFERVNEQRNWAYIHALKLERDALLEQNKALKERLEGLDLIEKSIEHQNERQHRLEAERNLWKCIAKKLAEHLREISENKGFPYLQHAALVALAEFEKDE